MTPEIQQRILYNLHKEPFREYPTPHFYSENIFPEDFYAQIQENLPADEHYSGIFALGRVSNPNNKPETRYVFSLKNDLDKLEGTQKTFWTHISQFCYSQHFLNAALRKYAPYIYQRFGNTFGNYDLIPMAELFRDVEGYEIGPHTDHQQRLLNLFFYLPATDEHPQMGTSFYVQRDPLKKLNVQSHNFFEDFINVHTVPHVPNVAAGFFRTDSSFHGVETLNVPGYKRNVLAYFILMKPKQ